MRRFALLQLVPSLLIPAAGISITADIREGFGLVGIPYFYILLGSMAVNGWLHTREPHVLAEGRLARAQAIIVLTVSALAFATLTAALVDATLRGSEFGTTLVLGGITAVASTVSWFMAVGAKRAPDPDVPPPAPRDWSARVARGGKWVCGLLAAMAVGAAAVAIVVPGQTWVSPAMIVLLVLGLPWAHPVVLLMTFVGFLASIVDSVSGLPQSVLAVPLFLAAATNAAGAWWITRNADNWHRAQTWYFRLRPAATEQ